jgi:hypothetical protein
VDESSGSFHFLDEKIWLKLLVYVAPGRELNPHTLSDIGF